MNRHFSSITDGSPHDLPSRRRVDACVSLVLWWQSLTAAFTTVINK